MMAPKVHALDALVIHSTKTLCGRSQTKRSPLVIVGAKDRSMVTCRRCSDILKNKDRARDRDRDPKTGRVRKYSAAEWRQKEAREEAARKKKVSSQGKSSRRKRRLSKKGRTDRERIRRARELWGLTAQQLHVVLGGVEAGRSLSYTRKCCQPSGYAMPPPLYVERAEDLLSEEPSTATLMRVADAKDDYPDERGDHTKRPKNRCEHSLKPIDLHADDAAPEVQCPGCLRYLRPLKKTKDGRVFLPYHKKSEPEPSSSSHRVPPEMRVRGQAERPETDQG